MSTKNVATHLSDHLAIHDLLNRYTNAINQRDWTAVEAAFALDGVWDAGGPELGENAYLFKTSQAIAKGIADLVKPHELLVQSNHAPVIEVDGDSATATSTINEYALAAGTPAMMVLWGTYYDDIVREADGEWRFRKRTFRYSWLENAAPRGHVMARFPRARR